MRPSIQARLRGSLDLTGDLTGNRFKQGSIRPVVEFDLKSLFFKGCSASLLHCRKKRFSVSKTLRFCNASYWFRTARLVFFRYGACQKFVDFAILLSAGVANVGATLSLNAYGQVRSDPRRYVLLVSKRLFQR